MWHSYFSQIPQSFSKRLPPSFLPHACFRGPQKISFALGYCSAAAHRYNYCFIFLCSSAELFYMLIQVTTFAKCSGIHLAALCLCVGSLPLPIVKNLVYAPRNAYLFCILFRASLQEIRWYNSSWSKFAICVLKVIN